MRKPFSQELYDQNDNLAKEVIISLLESVGVVIEDAREDFGADVKALHPIAHEGEVKRGWVGEWPEAWKDIHIPERKARLLGMHRKLIFWVVSGDGHRAWVVDGNQLKDDRLQEVGNSEIKSGERFFKIPTKNAKLLNVHDLLRKQNADL